MEETSEEKILGLYSDLQVLVRRLFEDMVKVHGLRMKVTEGVRSFEKQAALYAQGRSIPGKIVTNAQPGYSFHHYGLAFDSCFQGPDPFLEKNQKGYFYWREYGRLAEAHGLVWGGSFRLIKDRPHCQYTFGLSINECLELHRTGGEDAIFAQIDRIKEKSGIYSG